MASLHKIKFIFTIFIYIYIYKDLTVIVGVEHECTTFGSQTIEDEIGREDPGAIF